MMPDSKFPAGTFAPSDDVLIQPVAPSLATATLIRYEWRAIPGMYPEADAQALNALFAEGWEFNQSNNHVHLLRRQIP